jgi:DNA-binding transcriptional LysR family regulator
MPNGQPISRYELVDLRVFLAIVDEGSISRGAIRSHLAPSSVSERIAGLELSLGTTLLERLPRGVMPTLAGQVFADHARRCLAQLEQMHADLAPYATGLKGHVTLFVNNTALTSCLPEMLASFFAAHPQVYVTLKEAMSAEIVSAAAHGRADVGIVAGGVDHPELVFSPFIDVRLVMLVPRGHALASRQDVRLLECLSETFVSLHSGAAIHTFLMDRATELGHRPNVRIQVNDYTSVKRLVGSGAGIALAPDTVAELEDGNVAVVRLREGWAHRGSRICLRNSGTEASPNVRLLVEHLAEQARTWKASA